MKREIEAYPLPAGALLERYRNMPGAHTDCFSVHLDRPVSAAEFIEAFYTTALFKCERLVLLLIGRSCTDETVRALALGEVAAFAAWSVEERTGNEILVCDFADQTRSWLRVEADPDGGAGTRLYFGSAVVPRAKDSSGRPRLSAGFRMLLPVHTLYAQALLRAAAVKLSR